MHYRFKNGTVKRILKKYTTLCNKKKLNSRAQIMNVLLIINVSGLSITINQLHVLDFYNFYSLAIAPNSWVFDSFRAVPSSNVVDDASYDID
jgi:hypothetical protein